MEAEPATAPVSATATTTALPETVMTIDYEAEAPLETSVATDQAGALSADAEMRADEDDSIPPQPSNEIEIENATTAAEVEVEEAEMADDEASTWERDAMIDETELAPSTVPRTEAEGAATDDATIPPEGGAESAVGRAGASIDEATEVQSVETTTTTTRDAVNPSHATSIEMAALPDLNGTSTSAPRAATSNGDVVCDSRDELAPVSTEAALSEGEQADAEQSDFPHQTATTTTTTDAVATKGEHAAIVVDGSGASVASVPFVRPQIDKALLLGIEVPYPREASPSTPVAPAVLLNYDNSSYSLFQSYGSALSTTVERGEEAEEAADTVEGEEEEGEELPALLVGSSEQQLYFGTLEELFSKLHDQFPELQSREDELVLDFDEIGVALTEDNVYSRQVSLHDFDRIHLGCGLPGRLHARLYAQSRFSSGFNALAQHVATSLAGNANGVEGGLDSEATYEAEDGTVYGDDEESYEIVGEPQDHEADGPDSELPVVVDEEGDDQDQDFEPEAVADPVAAAAVDEPERAQEEGREGEGDDEDDFDLESALAQLDGDDIAAYAEGVAEDFILSEGQGEGGEGERDEENRTGEDRTGPAVVEPRGEDHGDDGAVGRLVDAGGVEGIGAADGGGDGHSERLADTVDAVREEAPAAEPASAPSGDRATANGNAAEAAPDAENSAVAGPVATTAESGATERGLSGTEDSSIELVPEETNGDLVNSNGPAQALDLEAADATDAVDPNDVVIDYDEAFDGSSVPIAAASATTKGLEAIPLVAGETAEPTGSDNSPKRRHDSLDDSQATNEPAEAETDGNDAKRPRLEEVSTAPETA